MDSITVFTTLTAAVIALAIYAGYAGSKAKMLAMWLEDTQKQLFKAQNELAWYRDWQHNIINRMDDDKDA